MFISHTGGHRSEPSHTSGSHHQHKVSGPHYGRGAGPHVNEYVLQEKSDRMRKDEQHKVSLVSHLLDIIAVFRIFSSGRYWRSSVRKRQRGCARREKTRKMK